MKKMMCLFILTTAVYADTNSVKRDDQFCQSSKEYITVFRYLGAQKIFTLKNDEKMKIADIASVGCNDSAKRFIEINDLLIKAGVETSDSLKIAMKFTSRNNKTTETFSTIFKEAFLKDYLDLDLKSALNYSLKLAFETDGDAEMIKNDFQRIVKFCIDHKNLDLSGPKCSDLAAKVAHSGAKFQLEIASLFLDYFDFLTDKEGVDLSTYKAIEMSVKLIDFGPLSFINFKDSYKFALSKSGLDMVKINAINYAELMARRSILESGSKQ